MRANKTETYANDAQAQARLVQLGATFKQDASDSKMWVYWSGRYRTWLGVERRGGKVSISYYDTCPCSK